ncbi:MAG TPA: hypothetical protein VHV49_16240 [Pseudonocardiaceae bacterium]|jgi:AcrR family transcriptional regulator|nr:hypothetical protein [Pseudonocardiaceae bacterium]
MRQADVPRSSVYNLWPTRGEFVDAVLRHLARPDWIDSAAFGQRASIDLALEVVRANRHRLRSVPDRIDVQREATRVAIARNFHDIIRAKG